MITPMPRINISVSCVIPIQKVINIGKNNSTEKNPNIFSYINENPLLVKENPFSNFRARLLTKKKEIFGGNRIENIAESPTKNM